MGAPNDPEPEEKTMIQGGCATLLVSNLDAARDFYGGILGLEEHFEIAGRWAEFDAGHGFRIALRCLPEGVTIAGGGVSVGLGVSHRLDDVVTRLRKRGVIITDDDLEEDDVVRMAHFRDPEGNPLYLWEVK